MDLEKAVDEFKQLMQEQLARIESLKQSDDWIDFKKKSSIVIGICAGDGIGPSITFQAQRVLEHVLKSKIKEKKIIINIINGLTIENRAKHKKAIPADVLKDLKQCDVILKGPTTTPQKGDGWPNIESANVVMRRELDLFACVRPIRVPEKSIDWVFFRENTEGAYALGSRGFSILEDLSVDFKIITEQGAERIIKMAFEFAKKNNRKRVTVVTKSNVVKTTDGRFSDVAKRIAKDYESYGITTDEWYIDIMTAKLLDERRAKEFDIFVLPNLYGDILTDEAGQIQGGVGTAGSSNIGKRYAMFEAVHGSAPRMVAENRDNFADPSSMIKAASMLLTHIGYQLISKKIDLALEKLVADKDIQITGHSDGHSAKSYTDALLNMLS